MDLHYGGEGWAWVREELGRLIPEKHLLRDAWLGEGSEVVDGKCLLRMKLDGLYRDVSTCPAHSVSVPVN